MLEMFHRTLVEPSRNEKYTENKTLALAFFNFTSLEDQTGAEAKDSVSVAYMLLMIGRIFFVSFWQLRR
jgi:hypothetical protein